MSQPRLQPPSTVVWGQDLADHLSELQRYAQIPADDAAIFVSVQKPINGSSGPDFWVVTVRRFLLFEAGQLQLQLDRSRITGVRHLRNGLLLPDQLELSLLPLPSSSSSGSPPGGAAVGHKEKDDTFNGPVAEQRVQLRLGSPEVVTWLCQILCPLAVELSAPQSSQLHQQQQTPRPAPTSHDGHRFNHHQLSILEHGSPPPQHSRAASADYPQGPRRSPPLPPGQLQFPPATLEQPQLIIQQSQHHSHQQQQPPQQINLRLQDSVHPEQLRLLQQQQLQSGQQHHRRHSDRSHTPWLENCSWTSTREGSISLAAFAKSSPSTTASAFPLPLHANQHPHLNRISNHSLSQNQDQSRTQGQIQSPNRHHFPPQWGDWKDRSRRRRQLHTLLRLQDQQLLELRRRSLLQQFTAMEPRANPDAGFLQNILDEARNTVVGPTDEKDVADEAGGDGSQPQPQPPAFDAAGNLLPAGLEEGYVVRLGDLRISLSLPVTSCSAPTNSANPLLRLRVSFGRWLDLRTSACPAAPLMRWPVSRTVMFPSGQLRDRWIQFQVLQVHPGGGLGPSEHILASTQVEAHLMQTCTLRLDQTLHTFPVFKPDGTMAGLVSFRASFEPLRQQLGFLRDGLQHHLLDHELQIVGDSITTAADAGIPASNASTTEGELRQEAISGASIGAGEGEMEPPGSEPEVVEGCASESQGVEGIWGCPPRQLAEEEPHPFPFRHGQLLRLRSLAAHGAALVLDSRSHRGLCGSAAPAEEHPELASLWRVEITANWPTEAGYDPAVELARRRRARRSALLAKQQPLQPHYGVAGREDRQLEVKERQDPLLHGSQPSLSPLAALPTAATALPVADPPDAPQLAPELQSSAAPKSAVAVSTAKLSKDPRDGGEPDDAESDAAGHFRGGPRRRVLGFEQAMQPVEPGWTLRLRNCLNGLYLRIADDEILDVGGSRGHLPHLRVSRCPPVVTAGREGRRLRRRLAAVRLRQRAERPLELLPGPLPLPMVNFSQPAVVASAEGQVHRPQPLVQPLPLPQLLSEPPIQAVPHFRSAEGDEADDLDAVEVDSEETAIRALAEAIGRVGFTLGGRGSFRGDGDGEDAAPGGGDKHLAGAAGVFHRTPEERAAALKRVWLPGLLGLRPLRTTPAASTPGALWSLESVVFPGRRVGLTNSGLPHAPARSLGPAAAISFELVPAREVDLLRAMDELDVRPSELRTLALRRHEWLQGENGADDSDDDSWAGPLPPLRHPVHSNPPNLVQLRSAPEPEAEALAATVSASSAPADAEDDLEPGNPSAPAALFPSQQLPPQHTSEIQATSVVGESRRSRWCDSRSLSTTPWSCRSSSTSNSSSNGDGRVRSFRFCGGGFGGGWSPFSLPGEHRGYGWWIHQQRRREQLCLISNNENNKSQKNSTASSNPPVENRLGQPPHQHLQPHPLRLSDASVSPPHLQGGEGVDVDDGEQPGGGLS